jgi:hypothetical protein
VEGTEHPKDAPLEVSRVIDVDVLEVAQGTVPAVTVTGVRHPPTQDALRTIRLADVVLAGARVADEIVALHGAEGGAPCGVPGVLEHAPELRPVQEHVVIAREGNFLGIRASRTGNAAAGGPFLAQLIASFDHSVTNRPVSDDIASEGCRSKARWVSVRSVGSSPWFSNAPQ